jgi:hypothetical protein
MGGRLKAKGFRNQVTGSKKYKTHKTQGKYNLRVLALLLVPLALSLSPGLPAVPADNL